MWFNPLLARGLIPDWILRRGVRSQGKERLNMMNKVDSTKEYSKFINEAYYLYWTQKHKYEVRNLIKQMQKELNKDEDYRQIIIKSYHQLLNILDRYGFIKTKTQTVREFTDVMRTALPLPTQSVKLLTSLFEIARYSGIKPKVVDEFGMEMIDGSYNIWCVEAINNLHEVEMELNKGLKEGKVSRFTNIFGMRSSK